MPTVERGSESGLEIAIPSEPQVAAQPYENKYYTGGGGSNHHVYSRLARSDQAGRYPTENRGSRYPVSDPTNRPGHQPKAKLKGRSRAFWLLAAIAIICLAMALGVGLGVGLAAQRKSSSPSDASTTSANNAPTTITQISDITTITPTPTSASPSCPAANGSTYTASNKPLVTDGSQMPQSSLAFEILCNKDVAEGDSVVDMQIIVNITSLRDCVDACALFNFQTKLNHFPANACTGISWGHGANLDPSDTCWLKSSVTLGSPNNTDIWPGYHGAVLLSN